MRDACAAEPVTALPAGLASGAPFVLRENRLNGAPALLFRDPVAIIRCERPADVAAAFADIEAGLARGLHAAGFLAYELGHVLEPRLRPLLPEERRDPLLWFGLFPPPLRIDARAVDLWFAGHAPPPPVTELRFGHDRALHAGRVGAILRLIAGGDIYQANLTFPIDFRYDGDPLAMYAALRAAQPVAHAALISTGDGHLLSVSPELFVSTVGDRAETRPMKGTAPRGSSPECDAQLRSGLAVDPKQRAENLMIVDLLRNDLARIAEPGSVSAPALFTVETYPRFHAMTSTITARLRPGVSFAERVAALFPCGSVVGAPKIRAAEILTRIEEGPRGVYTGSIGSISPAGDMDFNVAIRTVSLSASGDGRYGTGGGIVADSDPDAEYAEALLKAEILTRLAEPYCLIETFRWNAGGGFVRLEGHLTRLARSAAELGFAMDSSRLRNRLDVAALGWVEDMRVRLTLDRDGQAGVSAERLVPGAARPRLHVAAGRIDAADPFLRHKTSRRAVYEEAFAEARAAERDEAILVNRDGMLADGARNSLFVEIGGEMLTPRVADGALPGVLRAVLLAVGRAREAAIPADILPRADRLWIGNSLHGLRQAFPFS